MIKEKNGIKSYIQDFGELPLSIVFGFGEHDDQTSTLNKLLTDCIDQLAA